MRLSISALLHVLLLCIRSYELHLRIFYEKIGHKSVEQMYETLVNKIIDEYNEFLIPKKIRIQLDSVMAHDQYSLIDEYAELTAVAGQEDFDTRLRLLKNMPGNVILIASSPTPIDTDVSIVDSPCESKLIHNMSENDILGDDTLTHMIKGLRDWMSKIFEVSVPDATERNSFRIQEFAENVAKSGFIERLKKCSAERRRTEPEVLHRKEPKFDPNLIAKLDAIIAKMKKIQEEDEQRSKEECDSEQETGAPAGKKKRKPAHAIVSDSGYGSEAQASRKEAEEERVNPRIRTERPAPRRPSSRQGPSRKPPGRRPGAFVAQKPAPSRGMVDAINRLSYGLLHQ
jgi:hypothetical protein